MNQSLWTAVCGLNVNHFVLGESKENDLGWVSHLWFFCPVRQWDVFRVNNLVLGEFNKNCLSSDWYLWLFTESSDQMEKQSDSVGLRFDSLCFQPLNQHLNLWMRNVKVYIDITDFDVLANRILRHWDPCWITEREKPDLLLSVRLEETTKISKIIKRLTHLKLLYIKVSIFWLASLLMVHWTKLSASKRTGFKAKISFNITDST